jgi:tetraacyldisaccharide 4'-kinase
MSLAGDLQARWYGKASPPWWTVPLEALYGAVVRRRMARRNDPSTDRVRLPVPVVVVGNITAGGTGKTPLTIALVEALRARGWRPGVVSRGYGGQQVDRPRLLDERDTPREVGDEPCLIRQSGVPVAVGRNRPAAAQLLIAAGCNLVIADDGLQHYRLARDVEICVIDGVRRFGNARLLPAGPLREPLERLGSVDFRVCNGGEAEAGEVPMRLPGDTAVSLVDASANRPVSDFSVVHAVAAIGNPSRFFDSLRAHGLQPIEHPFADHHPFTAADFAFGDDLPVLMTDKDAVKCAGFAQAGWWRVPVRAELPLSFFDGIDQKCRLVTRSTSL